MNHQAELISIGSELLNGRTLNTHAQTLGGALDQIGLHLVRDTTIPDEISLISNTLKEAFNRSDLVFVTGGLGPTTDDITREAIADYTGLAITADAATVAIISERLRAKGRVPTAASARQGFVLEGATVLPNSVGAAPGQRIEWPNQKTLFLLPGPPNEFNAILTEEIIPWLQQQYPDARSNLKREMVSKGITESDVVTQLEAMNFDPAPVEIGFYPGNGRLLIELSAEPQYKPELLAVEKQLHDLLKAYLL